MRRASSLARSTPFRLAVTFTVLLVAGFLLAGAIVYRIMSVDLMERLDESVRETYSVIAATYGDGDLEDLTGVLASHAALQEDGQEQLFALLGPSGEPLAGNFIPDATAEGFFNLSDRGTTFRAFGGRVGDNVLIVAFSYAETRELQVIVLAGFGWATIIVGCLAIAGGVLLAARVQRRLDAISHTMAEVSVGRIASRIPLIGSGDDIDAVSFQINEALNRLATLMETTRQVGNDIAHELKTPLNRLNITLEQIKAKAEGQVGAELADAQGEMERINATFDALLRIAQIETGARRSQFRDVDLGGILKTIHEIYADVAADQDKSLNLSEDQSSLVISGDKDLLTQLFANLVENALRHCPAGTRIELGAHRNGRQIDTVVCDNGPGIPIEEREKVFRRLYRMDKSRTTPGSGLGLSLVKAVADLHGARVALSDAEPGLRVGIVFDAR